MPNNKTQRAGTCSVCRNPVAINGTLAGNIASAIGHTSPRCTGASRSVSHVFTEKHFFGSALINAPISEEFPILKPAYVL